MKKRVILVLALAVAVILGGLSFAFEPQAILAQAEPGDGLRAEILNVEIPSDRKPVVTFRLTNAAGAALTVEQMDANSVRFIITHLQQDPETGLSELLSYTVSSVAGREFTVDGEQVQPALDRASQAVYDSGGTFVRLSNGDYTYTFGSALPQGYNMDETHRVAMQATRDNRKWVANDTFDFKPNGQVAQAIDTVSNEACNRCHDVMSGHGGQRYLNELCVTCHTSQTVDPESGASQDYKVLIHKIHRGANLPSVQAGEAYFIVGHNQSVHDYSHVGYPQDIRNCTTCHNGANADAWKTQPSAEACGSCHDDVDFATGEGHIAGPATNDTCATCHPADGPEFGASVSGAHVIPEHSAQLAGVTFNLLGVRDTAPGQQLTVTFNITDKDGNIINPEDMSRLGFTLSGPTWEYQGYVAANALGATRMVDEETFEFTFPEPLPADAGDTWTIQIEGYLNTQLKDAAGNTIMGANGQPLVVRDAGYDQSLDFAVTGDTVWPRKQIVSEELCNECHQELYFHGGNRQNLDNCVLCHNPMVTDEAVRPADAGVPESIDLKVLIHKIHAGADLNNQPYVVYGRGGTPHDYSHVVLPTNKALCENCHVPGSQLPEFVHQGAQPVTVTQDGNFVSALAPTTAACTSCHDGAQAVAHALANTSPTGEESCALCHGSGGTSPVTEAHKVQFPVIDLPVR